MGEEKYARAKLALGLLVALISLFALVISFISLYFTFYGFSGEVYPIDPSSYAIMRGYDIWPSDHLIIPLSFVNTGTKSSVIRQPELILYELNNKGKKTGNQHHFILAGEFPDFSKKSFNESYAVVDSLIVEPRSITQRVWIFHPEFWWNESRPDYDFRFRPLINYSVDINYFKDLDDGKTTKQSLFTLHIYNWAKNLSINAWNYAYMFK